MAYVISCAQLFLAAAAAAKWAAAAAAAAAAALVSMAPPWRQCGHPSIYLQRSDAGYLSGGGGHPHGNNIDRLSSCSTAAVVD